MKCATCDEAETIAMIEQACADLADAEAPMVELLADTHGERRDEVYRRWSELVDMTPEQMAAWAADARSRKASVQSTDVLERTLRLIAKPKDSWDARDVRDAGRAISFISRMRQAPQGPEVDGCGLTARDIALRNWGCSGGGCAVTTLAARADDTLDAAVAAQRYIDRVASAGTTGAVAALRSPIDAVLAAVRASDSYEDLERRLPALAESLAAEASGSDFEALVESALQMAAAAGHWAVNEEAR